VYGLLYTTYLLGGFFWDFETLCGNCYNLMQSNSLACSDRKK